MNTGKLNMEKLARLAKSAGITREELIAAMRKNPSLVARYGATHSAR